jgi:hypothetical protein
MYEFEELTDNDDDDGGEADEHNVIGTEQEGVIRKIDYQRTREIQGRDKEDKEKTRVLVDKRKGLKKDDLYYTREGGYLC